MPLTPEERTRLITPENTAKLRKFLREGETDADIPECAYLLDLDMPPTAEDIEWGKRIFDDYMKRKYAELARQQENVDTLL